MLDKLSKAKRLKGTKSKLDLYLDEFGYQTNPPDKFTGITLTQQDQWLQRAAYQAWRNPRVKLFAQYLWIDEPRSLNNENGGWQSGVYFADGRAKPSPQALRDPVRARRLPRAPVGPGPHARDPDGHGRAQAGGLVLVAQDRHAPDRRPGLLELDDPAERRRVLPLPGRGSDERHFEAPVVLPRDV